MITPDPISQLLNTVGPQVRGSMYLLTADNDHWEIRMIKQFPLLPTIPPLIISWETFCCKCPQAWERRKIWIVKRFFYSKREDNSHFTTHTITLVFYWPFIIVGSTLTYVLSVTSESAWQMAQKNKGKKLKGLSALQEAKMPLSLSYSIKRTDYWNVC